MRHARAAGCKTSKAQNMKGGLFISLVFFSSLCQSAHAETIPSSFAYVLQAEYLAKTKARAVEQLAGCDRDWIILDAVFDDETSWDRNDLEVIRRGRVGRKLLAYLSIGEAEDYRAYWRKEWSRYGKLTATAPEWLVAENPEWKGNYRVKYWNETWQKLVLDAVDEAMERGFDGVYLDTVDGFEAFETDGAKYVDDRVNPETKQSYRRDMVDLVKAVADRARAIAPSALVVPQNGSQLLAHADFRKTINAIGIEDLFTDGDRLQSKSHVKKVLGYLKAMVEMQKPVLLIEYPKNPERQALSKKLATEHGMIWLITDRQLRTLGESGR